MLTRNKKLKDYGIPAEDIEKQDSCILVTLVMSNSQYTTPEKLQKNQQRKIYPDESEGLLRIQAQDRRCAV